MVLCQAMLFLPKSKVVCIRRKPGAAASQIRSMVVCLCVSRGFPNPSPVQAWPYWELLPLTGGYSRTLLLTARVVAFKVCRHTETYRHVRPCACNRRGTLLNGCWWLLMAAVQRREHRRRREALFWGWRQKSPCDLRRRRRKSKASQEFLKSCRNCWGGMEMEQTR